MKPKRIILIILFVLLNIAVIAITAVNEFGNSDNAAELSTVKIRAELLIPAALCFALALSSEIYKYWLMMKKIAVIKHDKLRQKKSVINSHALAVAGHTVVLGHYYDCITPAAIGGQPFQIYYMHKHSKLSSGEATAVPVFGMISSQIAFLIVAIICFMFGNADYNNPALMIPAWLGLIFYAFWPILLLGTSFFPKFTAKFLKSCVKFLAKIHIFKNPENTFDKIEREVKNYSNSVKLILKSRGLFIRVLLLAILFQILIASIPYFVLLAFGGEIGYIECLSTTLAVMSAICFIPTPGNAGVAEGTFFVVFSALADGYVFWAMLAWRFFSYYIYIIMGLLTFLVMHFEKKYDKIE